METSFSSNSCRLCMRKCSSCPSSYKDASISPARLRIRILFHFWVQPDDKSKIVCQDCFNTMMTFYEFHKRVKYVQNQFCNINIDDVQNSEDVKDPLEEFDPGFHQFVDIVKKETIECCYIKENNDSEMPLEQVVPKDECAAIDDNDSSSNSNSKTFTSYDYKENCTSFRNVFLDSTKTKDLARTKETIKVSESAVKNSKNNISDNYELPTEIFRNGKLLLKRTSLDKAFYKFYGLKCDMCEIKPFFKLSELFQHYESVHKTMGFVTCCDSKLYDRRVILWHMTRHLQPTAFECKICKKAVLNANALKKHMQTHIPESEKPHKCDECDKRYSNMTGLNYHKLTHIPIREGEGHKCKICGKVYASVLLYTTHMTNVHTKANFLCSECGQNSKTRAGLRMHMWTHDPPNKRSAKCPQCGVILKNEITLRVHMKVHSNDFIKCSLCKFSTTLKSRLKCHMQSKHSDSKPYSCTLCGKQFKFKNYLNNHMAQHTGQRKYTCSFCPKTFASSGNCFTHRRRMHPKEHANLKNKKQ